MMKTILFSLVLVMLTACSQQAAYTMIHEKERQECLKQGRSDCPRTYNYEKYKKQREEVIQFQNTEESR